MSIFHFRNLHILQSDEVFKITTDALVLAGLTTIEKGCKHVLDVGSGTGVLSLILKDRHPHLNILAIDIHEKAYQLTLNNFSNYHRNEGLFARHIPLDELDIPRVDLIISNPPYFSKSLTPSSTWKSMARHDSKFDWKIFFEKARQLSSEEGTVNLIMKTQELKRIEPYYQSQGWHIGKTVSIQDTKKSEPLLGFLSFKKRKVALVESSLILKKSSGAYTQEYLDLLQGWVDWK